MIANLHRRPRSVAAVVVAAAALIAVLASGASGRTGSRRAQRPWATINICDSAHARLGIRGHMPGNGTHEQIYMRFEAQFRRGASWQPVSGARSPWDHAGTAFTKFQEAGWTFGLSKPAAGGSYLLRGFVQFEWRAHRHGRTVVVRRAQTFTQGGHRGTKGAQPRNFSAARCRIHS